jgi:fluoride ion exporter CrcB/FEX
MEAVTLLRQGATGAALAYILASVILSLAGVFAGMRLLRLALR